MIYLNYAKLSVLAYAMLFMTTAVLAQSANSPNPNGITNAIQAGEICTNGIDDDGDGLIDALDPDCCGGWETRGSATTINGTAPYDYRLTDAVGTQGGGIWSTARFDFSQSFNVAFQANFGNIDANGADGIAFVIHNDPLGYNALIASGGGLGVGMVPCFTTEFDTWDNGAISADIPADHVAVYANNQVSNIPGGTAIQASTTSINIEDGAWHNIIIDWNVATLTFTVTFDGVQRIQTVYNFVQNIFSGNSILYFGFTASTGGSFNVQQVRNIVIAGTRVEVCGDGIDNDCDNLVDCADTDCQFTATATAGTSLCGDATVPLSVTTAPVVASNNINLPLYAWSGVNGFTATTSNTSVTGVNSSADGLYTVTVTANSGCTATASVNVSTFPMPVPVVSNNGPVCAGSSLVLTATLGTTYTWTGPNSYSSTGAGSATIANATPAASGTYLVSVTDANGCTGTGSTTAVINTTLSSTINTTQLRCDSTFISAEVPSGGSAPYTYNWNNGLAPTQTQAILTNFNNTYSVTITDANGCQGIAGFTTISHSSLNLSETHQASCFGASNASIDLSVTGGVPGAAGYIYNWNTGASTQDLFGLAGGTYCVTVTDATNCVDSLCVTIVTPPQLVVTMGSVLNATCPGACNGRATAQASGGNAPINVYTYEWSNGQTTPTATALCAGVVTVTVTDDNSCTTTATVTITEPTAFDLTITTTNVSCFNNANDGTATATAIGGLAPYAFTWSPNLVGASIAGLSTGNYAVTVTDANNCTYSEPFFIASPNPFNLTAATTDATCFGLSDGTISVNPFGGTPPYSYVWSNAQTTAMAVGIPANVSYSVTVTDANGCTSTSNNLSVSEPTQVSATATVLSQVSCNGLSDASVALATAGGTPAYTYLWDNLETSNTATALAAGSHRVTITDNNGCTAVNTVVITEPVPLQVTLSHNNVLCYGEANGNIIVDTVFGGTAPYAISLDSITWFSNISTGYMLDGLVAGAYEIWIRDANGCMVYFTQSISQPLQIGVNVDGIAIQLGESGVLSPSLMNEPVGAIYTWSLFDATISCEHCTTPTVNPTETRVYTLTVVGANTCTDSDTAIVVVNKGRRVFIPTAFSPNSDDLNDVFTVYGGAGVTGVKKMMVFDRWGELLFEQSNFAPNDPAYGWDGTFKGKPVPTNAFVYYIEVEFNDGQVLAYKGDVTMIK